MPYCILLLVFTFSFSTCSLCTQNIYFEATLAPNPRSQHQTVGFITATGNNNDAERQPGQSQETTFRLRTQEGEVTLSIRDRDEENSEITIEGPLTTDYQNMIRNTQSQFIRSILEAGDVIPENPSTFVYNISRNVDIEPYGYETRALFDNRIVFHLYIVHDAANITLSEGNITSIWLGDIHLRRTTREPRRLEALPRSIDDSSLFETIIHTSLIIHYRYYLNRHYRRVEVLTKAELLAEAEHRWLHNYRRSHSMGRRSHSRALHPYLPHQSRISGNHPLCDQNQGCSRDFGRSATH